MTDGEKKEGAHFEELPKETREFLASLREEDVESIKDAVAFYRAARSVGKFNLWLIGGVAGFIVASVAFGESLRTASKWFVK